MGVVALVRCLGRVIFLLCCCVVSAIAADLRVGMTADEPPLTFKQDGRLVGLEADNARAVSNILGRELQLVELPRQELFSALQKGRVDVVMSGLAISPDVNKLGQAGNVLYTEPYLKTGQMAVTLLEKAAHFAKPWAIYAQGIRVGVAPGSRGANFALSQLKDAEVRHIEPEADAFTALRKGEIHAYIHDPATSWQLATRKDTDDLISLYQPLTEEHLVWAVNAGNAALVVQLNNALSTMRANGTLRYITNRWIPVAVQ